MRKMTCPEIGSQKKSPKNRLSSKQVALQERTEIACIFTNEEKRIFQRKLFFASNIPMFF